MTYRRGRPRIALGVLAIAAALVAVGGGESFAKLEMWRRESAAAFAKHRREGVVVSDRGRVRLGRAPAPTFPLAADGSIHAATGDDGRVFRFGSTAEKTALNLSDLNTVVCLLMIRAGGAEGNAGDALLTVRD